MNFSVHFDANTLARLNAVVERGGVTRNRIIVRAVQDWLTRHEDEIWPESLLEHLQNPAPDLDQGAVDFQPWRPVR